VLLEGGVYNSTITDGGSHDSIGNPIGPEDLEPVRTRRGVIAGMRMAPTGSTDFRTMFSGKTEQRFRSQFLSKYEEVAPLKPDWITLITLTPEAESRAKKAESAWSWDERDAVKELFPNRSYFFREKLHGNLNFDLAQASVIGADLLPDGLNEPLLRMKIERGDVARRASGDRPLRILIPDVTQASWADIVEFRRWPGFESLRAKLRELDRVELNDRQVVEQIIAEYTAELERRQPTWRRVATRTALTFLGLIPGADTLIEGVGVARESADVLKLRTDWLATLIRARRYLEGRNTNTGSSSSSPSGSAAS
jgi:hypothetical protein